MKRDRSSREAPHVREPRGQVLVIFAFSLTVFLGAAMLGIDLSHFRGEVERAQHASDAAALAGVVFMPTFQSQAFYRAKEQATRNGYTANGAGVTVIPSTISGHVYRLRVTISAPVTLFFGHLFGLGQRQFTVSSIAEFLPPLQMGSPDYVLGFPRFPSYLTYDGSTAASRSPQNFYLTQEGPYTYKEQGDAFSPYFESTNSAFNGTSPSYVGTSGTGSNPCATNAPAPCSGTGVVANRAPNGGANFGGYKYVISIPTSQTVLVKLFNPFSEMNYNAIAACWDAGYKGATTEIRGLYAEYGYASSMCNSATTPPTQLSGLHIAPQDTSGTCILGTLSGGCRNESIDGSLWTSFGQLSGGSPDYNATPGNLAQTTLEYSLSGPGQSLLDPAMSSRTITALGSASTDKCAAATENCVISAPFDGGNDPTVCNTSKCDPSNVGYHFVNYAVLHGPGYFQLTVRSVVNSDGTYGESNHSYGVAVCSASNDATYNGNSNPLGSVSSNTYVTSNPLSSNPVDKGWNDASCLSPNSATTCPNPRLDTPGNCVHIYAEGALPLYNYLGQGSSLIPLGFIPPDYAGRTINVDFFDPGDIASSTNSPASVFGCLTPITSSSGVVPINSMEILTPAGDLQCGSPNHVDGNNNILGTNVQPGNLPYVFDAKPDYAASTYTTSSLANEAANQPLDIGNSSGGGNPGRFYNGSWVHTKLAIPSNYAQMTSGDGSANSAFGAYWKVLYRIGGNATDVTTWSLSVEGSTDHLVNP